MPALVDQADLDRVAASRQLLGVVDVDLDPRCRQREVAPTAPRPGRPAAGRRPARAAPSGRPPGRLGGSSASASSASTPVRAASTDVSCSSRSADLGGVGQHLVQGVAVLAPQLDQRVAPFPHRGQPLLVGLDRLGRAADFGDAVVQLGVERPQSVDQRDERAPVVERVHGRGRGRRPPRSRRPTARRRPRRPAGGRPRRRERPPRRSSASSSPRDGSSPVDLIELVPQQVDLAGARPLVATQLVELGRADRDAAAGGDRSAGAVDPGERSSASRWADGRSRALLAVLAVHLDEVGRQLGQAAARDQLAVHVGARPSARRHDPPEHPSRSSPTTNSPSTTASSAPGPHPAGVGPPPDSRLERLDHHRLAGAGLTRERGQPRLHRDAGPRR